MNNCVELAKRIDSESSDLGALIYKNRGHPPSLGILQLGENAASSKYIKYKKLKITSFNWDYTHVQLDHNCSELEVEEAIYNLQKCDGIILQLPIPTHISTKLIDCIPSTKDVDGITAINQGRLVKNYPEADFITPCTVCGCMFLLSESSVDLLGARVAVFGRSFLVGRPLQIMLERQGATVFSISRHDKDQAGISKQCQVLISAIGSPHYITQEYVNENAFVIDIGTTLVEGKTFGDVCPAVKAKHITPSISGIGPLTVSFLALNLAKCAYENC